MNGPQVRIIGPIQLGEQLDEKLSFPDIRAQALELTRLLRTLDEPPFRFTHGQFVQPKKGLTTYKDEAVENMLFVFDRYLDLSLHLDKTIAQKAVATEGIDRPDCRCIVRNTITGDGYLIWHTFDSRTLLPRTVDLTGLLDEPISPA